MKEGINGILKIASPGACKRSFPRWGIAESANQDFGFAFSLEFDKAAEEFAN
jgi:hypothetical protein